MTELTTTAGTPAEAATLNVPLAVRVAQERAAALALVRPLAGKGHALTYLAGALNRAGIPTLGGRVGARWTHQGVRRLADAEGIKL
jgi:hypothetical protein